MAELYLYMGMLGAGKTSRLREDIESGIYDGYKSILLIQNEDGIEQLSEDFLREHRIERQFILEPREYNREKLYGLDRSFEPEAVIMEVHGIWPIKVIVREMPRSWGLKTACYCADATEFQQEFKNMDRLIAEKIRICQKLYFHSAGDDTAQALEPILRIFRDKEVFYRE